MIDDPAAMEKLLNEQRRELRADGWNASARPRPPDFGPAPGSSLDRKLYSDRWWRAADRGTDAVSPDTSKRRCLTSSDADRRLADRCANPV